VHKLLGHIAALPIVVNVGLVLALLWSALPMLGTGSTALGAFFLVCAVVLIVGGLLPRLWSRLAHTPAEPPVAKRLAELYNEGRAFRAEIIDSTDETMPARECYERLAAWRQRVFDCLVESGATGKAHSVDADVRVRGVYRDDMTVRGGSHAPQPQSLAGAVPR
jgi:hypothetical protein